MAASSIILCWILSGWLTTVHCQSAIQLQTLSKPVITHIYSGMGAMFENKLYAIHGITCGTADGACSSVSQLVAYTLDLSGLSFTGSDKKEISISSDWQFTSITGTSLSDTYLTTAFGPEGFAYIDEFVWAPYPNTLVGAATNYIYKYDLSSNAFLQNNPTYTSTKDEYGVFSSSDTIIDSCVVSDGSSYVYSISGYRTTPTSDVDATCWRLDVSSNGWTQIASVTAARRRHSCALLDNFIYVLGGYNASAARSTFGDIERYQIDTNTWIDLTAINSEIQMAVPRGQHISYPHPNGKWIVTLGGRARDTADANVPIELFDTTTNAVLATNVLYRNKQYLTTIYHYSVNTSIIFVYGGNIDSAISNEVKYLVLHKDDYIASLSPTAAPSASPTTPTNNPTETPTNNPSKSPTNNPSASPTKTPSVSPSKSPTTSPSSDPSISPTENPSVSPTENPSTAPTKPPTISPSRPPTTPGQTLDPSSSPSTSPSDSPSTPPTRSPTQQPSVSPLKNPTTAPTARSSGIPSKTPAENEQEAPTTSLSPTEAPTPSEEDSGEPVLASTTDYDAVRNLNESVNVFIAGLIAVCAFFVVISFIANTFMYQGVDPPNYFALLWVVMEIYDFFSDVSFSVYLFYLKDHEDEKVLICFIAASIFIYLPYLSNLFYLGYRVRRWKEKHRTTGLGEWLAYWDWWLISLAMLTGGSHAAVEICNSLLFPMDAFGMHLPWTEVVRIRTERFCTTVLLENVPQLIIQLYLLIDIDIIGEGTIIYLTILSSIMSIAFSGLYYFVNLQKPKLSQNHWIFRLRLSSPKIGEYHKHSYYKIQVSVAKALEIPNVEWVRIVTVQHKADELRCDGFISIPESYLKKQKQRKKSNPEKEKQKEDARRLSAMYRNTFDDMESKEFEHRLHAAKESGSHYHNALKKQLEFDIKLTELKMDLEIGGKTDREGGGGQRPSIPIIHYGSEGDGRNPGVPGLGAGDANLMAQAQPPAAFGLYGLDNGSAQIEMQIMANYQRSISNLNARAVHNGAMNVMGGEEMKELAENETDILGAEGSGDDAELDEIDNLQINDIPLPYNRQEEEEKDNGMYSEPGSPQPAPASSSDFDGVKHENQAFILDDEKEGKENLAKSVSSENVDGAVLKHMSMDELQSDPDEQVNSDDDVMDSFADATLK